MKLDKVKRQTLRKVELPDNNPVDESNVEQMPVKQPDLPSKEHEQLISRGGSHTEKRGGRRTPIAFLVRQKKLQQKRSARKSAQRMEEARSKADKKADEALANSLSNRRIDNIVEGMEEHRDDLNDAEDRKEDWNYDEFLYHDDKVRYGEELREKRAVEQQANTRIARLEQEMLELENDLEKSEFDDEVDEFSSGPSDSGYSPDGTLRDDYEYEFKDIEHRRYRDREDD